MAMNTILSFWVPCAFIAVASVPLILKIVPPNRLYGFRTPKTLANRDVWFRANRFAGWALLIASATSAFLFALEPQYASGRSLAGLGIFIMPLVIAVVTSLAYLQSLGEPG